MIRTTILLDNNMMLLLRQLASADGKTLTAIIREALAAYIETRQEPQRFSFIASGRSGKGNLSRDVEKILRQRARRPRK
ncbi:MAG: ribbon-helix-helix protein, CopG family [Blastocatellia bacterium]